MSSCAAISARPLILAGMHRSGTSLTASIFASAGLDLGSELLGPGSSNQLGHFEDVGILDFHFRALVAQGVSGDGFTATARGTVPASMEHEARTLVAARMRPDVAWGWKEPRTTLFLDFWLEQVPDARYVFVFRRPWEVADSMFRRGDVTFALNPTFLFEVWTHYNRLILDFVQRHPARCAVFDVSQVIADASRIVADVRSRLDVPLTAPADRYREALFTRDGDSLRSGLVRTLSPEAWHTYEALCELSGVSVDRSVGNRQVAPGECAVIEWARASRAEKRASQAAEREASLRAEHEALIRAEHEAKVRAEHEAKVRAEHEAKVRAERSSPWKKLRRSVRRISAGIAGLFSEAWRRFRRNAPAGEPDVLQFPTAADAPAEKQAL